jgi:hypothetical protein
MLIVKFATLQGSFAVLPAEFETRSAALAAVKAYAEAAGYTNVREVEDAEDPCSFRYTARTPGGRGGRNVAFAEFADFADFDFE